jgi:hypothetical protein
MSTFTCVTRSVNLTIGTEALSSTRIDCGSAIRLFSSSTSSVRNGSFSQRPMTTKSGKRGRGLETGEIVEDSRASERLWRLLEHPGCFWEILKVSEGSWNHQKDLGIIRRILESSEGFRKLLEDSGPSEESRISLEDPNSILRFLTHSRRIKRLLETRLLTNITCRQI